MRIAICSNLLRSRLNYCFQAKLMRNASRIFLTRPPWMIAAADQAIWKLKMWRKQSTFVTAVQEEEEVEEVNLKWVNFKMICATVAVIITTITYGDLVTNRREEDWDRILLKSNNPICYIVIRNSNSKEEIFLEQGYPFLHRTTTAKKTYLRTAEYLEVIAI